MSDISQWATTADGNNTLQPPDGFPEGMSYASVNNSARELQASIARYRRDHDGSLSLPGLIIGTTVDITLNRTSATGSATPAAIGSFVARAQANLPAEARLRVNGGDSYPIVTANGLAVSGNEVQAGGIYTFVWRAASGAWQVAGTVGTELEATTINRRTGNTIEIFGDTEIADTLDIGNRVPGATNLLQPITADAGLPLKIANRGDQGVTAASAQNVGLGFYFGDVVSTLLGRLGYINSTGLSLRNLIPNGALTLLRTAAGVSRTVLDADNSRTILYNGGGGSAVVAENPDLPVAGAGRLLLVGPTGNVMVASASDTNILGGSTVTATPSGGSFLTMTGTSGNLTMSSNDGLDLVASDRATLRGTEARLTGSTNVQVTAGSRVALVAETDGGDFRRRVDPTVRVTPGGLTAAAGDAGRVIYIQATTVGATPAVIWSSLGTHVLTSTAPIGQETEYILVDTNNPSGFDPFPIIPISGITILTRVVNTGVFYSSIRFRCIAASTFVMELTRL